MDPRLAADRYDQMLGLADLFASTAEQLRASGEEGARLLREDDVAATAELSRTTYEEAEAEVRRATSPAGGLSAHSLDLEADALAIRSTVRTYQWIDQLREAATRTLGEVAGRAVGYLAPEVELGGEILTAGLIETEAGDRGALADYLDELAADNPDLMEHLTTGGSGLIEGLQLRTLLTAGVMGSELGAPAARAGLRATGAADFDVSAGAAIRDAAAGFPEDPESTDDTDSSAGSSGPEIVDTAPPAGLVDLIERLEQHSRPGSPLTLERVADAERGDLLIAYVGPAAAPRENAPGVRLVGAADLAQARTVARDVLTALDTTGATPSRVMLVGSGRGGETAARVACCPELPPVLQVVTVGAASTDLPTLPTGTRLLALDDSADPVALLGSLIGSGEPPREDRITVTYDAGDAVGSEARLAGARAADQSDHPGLRGALRALRTDGLLA